MANRKITTILTAVGIVGVMFAGSATAQPLMCTDRTALGVPEDAERHQQRYHDRCQEGNHVAGLLGCIRLFGYSGTRGLVTTRHRLDHRRHRWSRSGRGMRSTPLYERIRGCGR